MAWDLQVARTGAGAACKDVGVFYPRREVRRQKPVTASAHRASQQGFLPLALDDYLVLLDWTGRQARAKKVGFVPAHPKPILERLQNNTGRWVESVLTLSRRSHRAIRRASSMAARANGSGKRWLHGVSASRLVFS